MARRQAAKGIHGPDPIVRAHRITKAYRLATWIEQEVGEALDEKHVDALATMSDEWWAAAASHAGVRVPSEETRALVAATLRARLDKTDPFARFEEAGL